MKSFYFTLSRTQGGPGYIEVIAPDAGAAREDMFRIVGDRWAFQYGSLDEVHELDRFSRGRIEVTKSKLEILIAIDRGIGEMK